MSGQLDEQGLGDYIDARYQQRGDHLFRMERLPVYEGNAPQTARWLTGAAEPDWATKQGWLDVLADDKRRGLVSRRVRILSEALTDDERAACAFGYAYNGRHEDIRVLHRGEHPVPDLLDHDYWIITPTHGRVSVLAMHYSPDGRFTGATEVPPTQHGPYIEEARLSWAIGEPFHQWWDRHGDLHQRRVA